jgi:hypothetical protein
MHMRALPPAFPRRRARVLAGLLVYLLGTNYCLVGMLPGADRLAMSCMPGAATASADVAGAKPSGHCHAPAAETGGDESASTGTALPCCVAYSPVVAPGLALPEPGEVVVAVVPADAAVTAEVPATPGHLLSPPPSESPPALLARAPIAPRAPPLV